MLIRLFQHNSICWDGVLVERPGKVCAAPYLLICGRLAPGPETEQGLEGGHGLPAPIVAKDEFIKINLKLIAAHAVIGSDQPLLEDSQWRDPPKAAPTSRLCADRFAGAEGEAHAEIRLAAIPQSS